MRNFRLLNASEIECRISETKMASNGKGYVRLLLYKTARTDAALLDEKFGMFGWQNEYKVIDGKMYCGIGIKSDSGEWIWKWNVGTESNTEAEKGQASDALKRAGFTLGLGTELYSAPDITIWSPTVEIKEANGKARCYERFDVKEIGYDDNENINLLVIVNSKGKEVFRMGGYASKTKQGVSATQKAREGDFNASVVTSSSNEKTSLKTASGEPKATTEQVLAIMQLSKDVNSILRYYNVARLEDLPVGTAEDVIQRLKKAREKG